MYGNNVDFYAAKGIVEHTVDTLGIKNVEFLPAKDIFWMQQIILIDANGQRTVYQGAQKPGQPRNLHGAGPPRTLQNRAARTRGAGLRAAGR